MPDILLGTRTFSIEDLAAVGRKRQRVRLADEALERVVQARRLVEGWVLEGRVIYGITTGFGALSDVTIEPENVRQLQENILMSHAAGVGAPLPEEVVRVTLALRIQGPGPGVFGRSAGNPASHDRSAAQRSLSDRARKGVGRRQRGPLPHGPSGPAADRAGGGGISGPPDDRPGGPGRGRTGTHPPGGRRRTGPDQRHPGHDRRHGPGRNGRRATRQNGRYRLRPQPGSPHGHQYRIRSTDSPGPPPSRPDPFGGEYGTPDRRQRHHVLAQGLFAHPGCLHPSLLAQIHGPAGTPWPTSAG